MFTMFLSSKVGRLLAALLAGAALIFGSIQFGRKAQKESQKVDDLEDYIETNKEIDDVEAASNSDDAFDRMRDNGWLR